MANVLDYDNFVSEFELQSSICIHFRMLRKINKSRILLAMGLKYNYYFSIMDGFDIK